MKRYLYCLHFHLIWIKFSTGYVHKNFLSNCEIRKIGELKAMLHLETQMFKSVLPTSTD